MNENLIVFGLIGFMAQLIDGTLGMGYGVSSTAFLLSFGLPPAIASASVHTAEIFANAVSGLAHLKFGNVDKKLFKRLVIPGVIGGVGGACLLVSISGEKLIPFVAAYLLLMGLKIFYQTFKKTDEKEVSTMLFPLGLAGGFVDAVGGGGWGPVVTSTIMARGHNPRLAIGSANLAEFFVTTTQVVIFFAFMGLGYWPVIAALIAGSVLAAPVSAYLCKKLPVRVLMIAVGLLIILLSSRMLYKSLL